MMKSKICLVVAIEKNFGIGFRQQLPWSHLTEEMKYFKKITIGSGNNAVIMGRKTWDSIEVKPLCERVNVVLTGDCENFLAKYKKMNVLCFNNLNSCFESLQKLNLDEIHFIGGGQIFTKLIKGHVSKIDRIYLTRITSSFESDTFFPQISDDFVLDDKYTHFYKHTDKKHGISWTNELWNNVKKTK